MSKGVPAFGSSWETFSQTFPERFTDCQKEYKDKTIQYVVVCNDMDILTGVLQ